MTCNKCPKPTHFCYLCGSILNEENPLKHFSNKESKCYNKLWDDPEKNIDIDDEDNENINNEEQKEENKEEKIEDNKEYENDNNFNNISKNQNEMNDNENNYYENMDLTQLMFDKVNNNSLYNCPTPIKRNNKFFYNKNYK